MATWDYSLIKDAASIMSEEASKDGVHWTFAPMLDVCNEPRWGRIIECPGEDPYLGCVFAKASVESIQGDDMSKEGKLAACAKHYIGYGASSGGRDKDATEWSDYSLRNRALPAFKAAIDAGVDMDMVDCLYKNHLCQAVEKGLASMETIDEAVRRVLNIKFRLGLFDNPYFNEDICNEDFLKDEYLEKAKEVAFIPWCF